MMGFPMFDRIRTRWQTHRHHWPHDNTSRRKVKTQTMPLRGVFINRSNNWLGKCVRSSFQESEISLAFCGNSVRYIPSHKFGKAYLRSGTKPLEKIHKTRIFNLNVGKQRVKTFSHTPPPPHNDALGWNFLFNIEWGRRGFGILHEQLICEK